MTILVIGASGNVGRNVVGGLLASGERVRAASRNPEAAGLPDGAEPVALDLTDPATLPAALREVRKVFLYTKPERVHAFVDVAREAGVEHVVLLSSSSVVSADAKVNPIAQYHAAVAAAQGKPAQLSPVFEQVTGRPGRSFAHWAADHGADFR
jgi:uncharacterized protein YbjT (DUF2867 family)